MSHHGDAEPDCPSPACTHTHSPGGWYLCGNCHSWHKAPCTEQKARVTEKVLGVDAMPVSPLAPSGSSVPVFVCAQCRVMYVEDEVCPGCGSRDPLKVWFENSSVQLSPP